MPNKRGRGRPRGSRVQNCQEKAHGNFNSHININPLNLVEAGPGCEESEETGMVISIAIRKIICFPLYSSFCYDNMMFIHIKQHYQVARCSY